MNEHERVRGLIRSLGSTVRNRQAALQELSEYGDNSLAIEATIAALGDGNSGVQRMADSMIMRLGEKAFGHLIAASHHESPRMRQVVASSESLVRICGTRAVEPLMDVLEHDTEHAVRGEAARALGRIGDRRALGVLIAALDDAFPTVRLGAAMALGELGDAMAIPGLTEHLGDVHSLVRARSAEALGRIGHADSLRPLRSALLRVLGQMIRNPGVLTGYQEEKHLRERREAGRLARERRRKYYRELGKS